MTSTVRHQRTQPLGDARLAAYGLVDRLPAEVVELALAHSRHLAEPVLALDDLPGFTTAAMDGWAVAGLGPWQLLPGYLAPGTPGQRIPGGWARQIATGAVVPRGAAGVLRCEDGELSDGMLRGALRSGRDLRQRGSECQAGDVLVEAGTLVTPPVVGLAAAAGHDELCVARRPRVALAVLGDELEVAGRPPVGRVRDSLGPQLPMWASALGGDVTTVRRVADNVGDTVAGLCARGDVIVTTGGTAAGPADHLRDALRVLGADIVVDGVSIRPGHPMLLARRRDGVPIVGLPGNPLAAVAGVLTLLEPLIAKLTGRALPALRTALMAERLPAAGSTPRLVPVSIDDCGIATALPHAGPAMLRGLAAADALAIVAPAGVDWGVRLPVLDLPWRDASREMVGNKRD